MATREEYAKLSMAVYGDGVTGNAANVAGWIKLQVDLPPGAATSGFYAAAYLNPQTKEIVIAYRGTDDLKDVAADTALSADVTHQQFIDALEFAKSIDKSYGAAGYSISVTGHSLGGGLAQLAADVYSWNGETFDPPGMGQLTDNAQLTAWATQNGQSFGHIGTGFMNNTVSGSAISSVGEHIGGTNSITTTDRPIALVIATAWQVPLPVAIVIAGSDLMERHSIANIYTHLQAQSSAGLVLQEYIDQYLRHGVSGYTPPDQGLFDSFKEFFSDLFQGELELTQEQAEALIADLEFLRANDSLFAGNTAAQDDLIKAQDQLRLATQDITKISTDNAHWTEQPGPGNEITIRIELQHTLSQTEQWLKIELPSTNAITGEPKGYVIVSNNVLPVTTDYGGVLDTPTIDYYLLRVEPGANYAELTLRASPDSNTADDRLNLGDIQVTVVGRDESATTVQSVPLSIHESALPVMPTQFNQPIVGDLKAKDFAPEVEGEQTRTDELGNLVTTDQPDPDREDVLYDSSGNDSISGRGGNDYINAWRGGDDKLDGGTGSDVIMAFDGNDIVIGGEGADLVGGGNNDDYVFGGAEVTLTEAFAAQDAEASGEKGDLVDGNAGKDVLVGDVGNDVIHGGTDEDILLGGAGDDVMYGDAEVQNATREWTVTRSITEENGGRRYNTDYQNASVTLVAGSHDVMFGGAGSDWMFGGEGHDYLDGGNHADVLFGEAGHDTLLGGDGNDMLAGDGEGVPQEEQGDDYLDGGAGDDELIGMAGNDTLLGGADNDQLYGGDGDDFLDGGSGNDLLNGGSGNNTLNGGDGTDTLLGNVDNDIIFGGIGDDVAGGHNGDDAIYGEAGNDQLQGGTGLDLLDGGADNDVLFGEGDNDILLGGSGNDQLIGGSGHDTLDGGDDADVLYGDDGDDTLLGGAGDDYLIGGVGNDFLNGGQGNDVYYFRLGEGIDHLADDGGSYDWLVIENGTLEDVARLDVGSLAIVFNDGSELHLDDFDPDNPGSGAIEYIMFADGTVVTTQQLVDMFGFQVEGTPGEDELSGTALDDSINAYDGNDVVDGRAGNDVISLGGGDDIALGGDGNDLVTAGAGDDMVLAGNGHDVVYGGSEADTLYGEAGNDHLYGEGGNDWLAGGSGSDILEGGAGNDSYLFNLGDGQDRIIDTAGANQVVLGSDVTTDNVSFRRQGDDLVIAISGTSDQLTVTDWFTGNDASWVVMLGDGTILNQAEVEALVGRNEAPQAQSDGASLGEGTATPVTLNVLANDSDPEGLPLSVTNPGVYHGLYGTLTLLANGSASYQLNTAAPEVQAMADGQIYTDTFVYTVTDASPDGAQNSSATVSFTITGANDGPVAHADAGSVSEDGALTASGNVLDNDSDVDAGEHLRVAAGSYAGDYGTLVMQIDGNYQYTLNNDAAQALGRNDVVTEQFSYSVIDSAGAQATATLTIAVQGVNDAPVLAVPLADQSATPNRDFAWQIPDGAFTDADAGDVLRYSATLADGSALPDWLVFDAASGTFSGRVPRDATGYLDIVVTATDSVGGVVGADDLSTSDIFRLSFEAGGGGGGGGSGGGGNGGGNGDGHGNAGVGNGEDPPPPGHDDDFNDGPGTGPGSPGAQGPDGNRPQPIELDDLYDDHPGVGTNHVRRGRRPHAAPGGGGDEVVAQTNNNADSDSAFDDWFGTESTEPEFASAPFWIEPEPWVDDEDEETQRNGNATTPYQVWEQVDHRLPGYLAGNGQGAAPGFEGAAIGLNNGAGFLGSTAAVQDDPLSLGAVNGNRMNAFRGLSEGLSQAR